ncbi:mitochondrial ribosomal protein MRP51 [Xylariaceae sp. FL0016]|nr:mitochondrial ribosomal protein MRP51 [Xylariaceae sp. FL0016]
MAGRSVSPGAALLRSSRMFSMPAPIPPPPGDYSGATTHFSPTATINFPTHLSVTTPSTSRINGDWGFKRNFPLKTTTTTTIPLVRVRQVDSTEHVTDFQTSSDHTITLKKFQELSMAISVPSDPEDIHGAKKQHVNPRSVFEEDGDVTALDDKTALETENKRWKFKGPWLAGMTDGDFSRYLEKTVRTKRPEFRAYLKEVLAKDMTEDQQRQARAELAAEMPAAVTSSDITESQLIDYLKRLRDDRMQLYTLVSRFLDLAPVSGETGLGPLGRWPAEQQREVNSPSPYGANGPPITHPSAGLSYLRTMNYQENHPVYGPQLQRTPVQTRVLMPRSPPAGHFHVSLGIAGFVAATKQDSTFNLSNQAQSQNRTGVALHSLDLTNRGGAKLFAVPQTASVDSNGSLRLTIDESNPEARLVAQEKIGEADVYHSHMKGQVNPDVPLNPRSQPRHGKWQAGSAQGYGFGIRSKSNGKQ